MKCPSCGFEDTQVKDSRTIDEGNTIRRRRTCPQCNTRFTTLEHIQFRDITVVKKNGERKPFDRAKIYNSLSMALRKRNVPHDKIESMVNKIVMDINDLGENEISTSDIGEKVMEELREVDKIAYIRFASVYRDFCEVSDFEQFVKSLKKKK